MTLIKIKQSDLEKAIQNGDGAMINPRRITAYLNKMTKKQYDNIECHQANVKDVEINNLKDQLKDAVSDLATYRRDYEELEGEYKSQEDLIESFREGEDTYIEQNDTLEAQVIFYKLIIEKLVQ